MKFELKVAIRYLKTGHKSRFISLVTFISILGVAVGVMTLIVVLSVMSGFDNDLRDKIISVNPHIYIQSQEGIENPNEVIENIKGIEHIEAASPFIEGQALFRKDKQVLGVMVRGVDPENEPKVTKIKEYLIKGSLPEDENGILIGSELAKNFNLRLFDSITVISPMKGKKFKFNVCGIFNSGMYEYDSALTYINLSQAQIFFDIGSLVSAIGVKIDNLSLAKKVKGDILKTLGFRYWVRTWMEINQNLFSSLKLEKTAMFIILVLIILVACFNIISTLIMTVMEKTKDIGILKSLGVNNRSIAFIFTYCGLAIGILGTTLGAGAGFYLCYLLKTYKFIKLPADIYYIDTLPVLIQWSDSLIIVLSAIAISFLATLYPAHQAARLNPIEALRYE